MKRPNLQIAKLREIGWQFWDPIGLISKGENWKDKPFADEYDSYLVQAAGRLRREIPKSEVVQYLIDIEANHMGMGKNNTADLRAKQTVEAIISNDQLWA